MNRRLRRAVDPDKLAAALAVLKTLRGTLTPLPDGRAMLTIAGMTKVHPTLRDAVAVVLDARRRHGANHAIRG